MLEILSHCKFGSPISPILQPHQIGTTWQYTIDWIPSDTGNGGTLSKNVVVVSSKPRSRSESDLIVVDAWTSEANGWNRSEVSVFVQVTRGGMPVLGARVRMEVTSAEKGTTLFVADMLDDGFGGELGPKMTGRAGRPILCSDMSYICQPGRGELKQNGRRWRS